MLNRIKNVILYVGQNLHPTPPQPGFYAFWLSITADVLVVIKYRQHFALYSHNIGYTKLFCLALLKVGMIWRIHINNMPASRM